MRLYGLPDWSLLRNGDRMATFLDQIALLGVAVKTKDGQTQCLQANTIGAAALAVGGPMNVIRTTQRGHRTSGHAW
jgi:hypothetical protein